MQDRTTIQLSGDLRKQLKILASKRDISYQELLQDMISIFQELDKEKTIISIPSLLSQKIKNQITNTDFNSVSEYTTFILRQILMKTEEGMKLTEKDEEKIKYQLKKIGYL